MILTALVSAMRANLLTQEALLRLPPSRRNSYSAIRCSIVQSEAFCIVTKKSAALPSVHESVQTTSWSGSLVTNPLALKPLLHPLTGKPIQHESDKRQFLDKANLALNFDGLLFLDILEMRTETPT